MRSKINWKNRSDFLMIVAYWYYCTLHAPNVVDWSQDLKQNTVLTNAKIKQIDKKTYDFRKLMNGKDHQQICNTIAKISPYIRFAGVIGKNGDLLASFRRTDLKPLLNPKNMNY